MTTIINTPNPRSGDDSFFNMMIGILIAIILVGLFVFYGLPLLRNSQVPAAPNPTPTTQGGDTTNIEINLPSATTSATVK